MTAASEVGFQYIDKKGEVYSIKINNITKSFLLLTKIDFSSDRKRMSVVLKDLQTDGIFLFCKGADSMILSRLSEDNSPDDVEQTNLDVQAFSKEGLRTLAVGYKRLDTTAFTKWQERYAQAQEEVFNVLSEIDPQIKIREVDLYYDMIFY